MDAEAFKVAIPDSVIPYPKGLWNRVKYVFWKAITPGWLFGRDLLLRLNIVHHAGRQNWVIGTLASGRSSEGFIQYLHTKGFFNHFIAWHDDDQVFSLRLLVDFEWQYHIRLFKDGEIRGHYEYTPEAHPRWHVKEVRWEPRRGEFLEFLGDWVVPSQEMIRED